MPEDALVNTGGLLLWPGLLTAQQRVLEIQSKLHLWAGHDRDRGFADLFNLVADPAFLAVAWDRVRFNKGARSAGVDGQTAYYVETERGRDKFLAEVRDALRSQTFRPLPVRERLIPKPGTRKRRRLGNVPLAICGDVERPARLALTELRSLTDAELVADFHCREGWSRLGERWRGVRLRTLLALAGAAEAAGYVTVGSGEYTAVLTREQAEDERVLLAVEHEGAPSPRRAGFPRLVGPSEWDCFLSVKSVDRIEVTRQPQQATAAAICARPTRTLGGQHACGPVAP